MAGTEGRGGKFEVKVPGVGCFEQGILLWISPRGQTP